MASDGKSADLYAELEVQSTDDLATIKKSYRRLVLKYHPDKNPDDRSAAEERIRKINNAYETLSVPAKRQQYDMQMQSMSTRKSGIRVDTTLVQPRFAIPKSFMMCPMGHPDKFVRAVGPKLVVQSRADVSHLDFDAFFQPAQFKLWWIKTEEVNNLCRLKISDSSCTGIQMFMTGRPNAPPPTFNLNFALSVTSASADVMLTPLEQPTTTNVVAQVSPEYPGAFRFEAAYFAGCHIAFDPPDRVQMMRRDQSCTIDFMLLDYQSAELHRTLDEILVPVVCELGGHMTAIKLMDVCRHRRVIKYFQEIMCGEFWDFNDFALHFHAHDDKWQYYERTRELKLRSSEEQVACSLKKSRTPTEAVRALMKHSQCDLCSLPYDSLAVGLEMLSESKVVASKLPQEFPSAQMLLLTTLKKMCARADRRNGHALFQFTRLWDSLVGFDKRNYGAEVKALVSENKDAIVELASHLIQLKDTVVDDKLLELVLRMPLDWDKHGEELSKKGQRSIMPLPLDRIVPLIKLAASGKVQAFGECLASSSMMKLFGVDANVALDALEAMVSGGFGLEGVPMMLPTFLPKASPELAARIIAGLAERNVKGPSFDACWQAVAEKESVLAALPFRLRESLKYGKEERPRSRSREGGSKAKD